jgi:hypothetical protein
MNVSLAYEAELGKCARIGLTEGATISHSSSLNAFVITLPPDGQVQKTEIIIALFTCDHAHEKTAKSIAIENVRTFMTKCAKVDHVSIEYISDALPFAQGVGFSEAGHWWLARVYITHDGLWLLHWNGLEQLMETEVLEIFDSFSVGQ